jgi:thymidylate kinase
MNKIVCIEGGDASGKNTQSKILAERLGAAHFAFPDYRTIAGQAILGNLQRKWCAVRQKPVGRTLDERGGSDVYEYAADDRINAMVLQSLMLTNRMELGAELRAAVERGHVVLDRYDASARVFGERDGLDPAWLELTNAQLPVRPNLYILIDVPVEESWKRRPERRDRYESDWKFAEGVREGYLKLFAEQQRLHVEQPEKYGVPYVTVNGLGTVEEVSARIWDAVSRRISSASTIDVSGPPVGSQQIHLGFVPKMNEDERQCDGCGRVFGMRDDGVEDYCTTCQPNAIEHEYWCERNECNCGAEDRARRERELRTHTCTAVEPGAGCITCNRPVVPR